MSVVRYISDRIAVMYAGKLAEIGPKREILTRPKHPYTEALLAAVPKASKGQKSHRTILAGEPPDLSHLPSGCVLHPRCKYAKDICREEEPILQEVGPDHYASCHFTDVLTLEGIN
jgi:oligopeptide/dipeptide ABC transporter ATP-binding protein